MKTVRRWLVGFTLVAGISAVLATAGAQGLTGYHGCGDYRASGELYTHVRAKSASCSTARAVVRGWTRTNSSNTGWRRLRSPRGWRCIFLYSDARQRFYCEHIGRGRVRFEPGPEF